MKKEFFSFIFLFITMLVFISCGNDNEELLPNPSPEIVPLKKYGVKWSITDYNDLGNRCFDAVGLSSQIGIGPDGGYSDFDRVYPWSEIKRCNIHKDLFGSVSITYEGDDGFSLDGSNGDVFVRIPKFAVDKYIDDGYEYRVISQQGKIHPLFIENGVELDEVFVAAFEASLKDSKLYSTAGVIPANNVTPVEFLAAANAKGIGYSLYDMRCVDAIWTLMAVEYGCRNSNRIIGYGYSDFQQPATYNPWSSVSQNAESTNVVTLGIPSSDYTRIRVLSNLSPGNNMTICDGDQRKIVAQRKIVNITCNSLSDNIKVTFDGEPIDVTTNMFVGNAPCDCNYCESIGKEYKLNWHTGRSNKVPDEGTGFDVETQNPCRYRWIENVVGNVWHFLPDVTFNNGQMHICSNIAEYEISKTTPPYNQVGGKFPFQESNGYKSDINTAVNPNYWITGIFSDSGSDDTYIFGKSFDLYHDGQLTSKKGFGGYYYLGKGIKIIVNGGGFDHLWRCNMLTNRAWVDKDSKWYLYGARFLFKKIS